jgi:hypothetical protein
MLMQIMSSRKVESANLGGLLHDPHQRCRSHFKETMKMYPTNHDEPSIDIIPHPKPLRG